MSLNVLNYFLFHRQGAQGILERSHHAKTREIPLMKALPIKAMLTVEGTIKGPGNEMDKDKDVYGTI